MTTNNETAPGEVTGNVLFYTQPEPLSIELHGKFGVKRQDKPFAFAATTHVVPLTVTEFPTASVSYPIIFVGDDLSPAVVMGLRAGENLFISNGDFEYDAYVPAFIRRVPFVFANDDTQGRMILCIDRGSPIVDPNGGDIALFENGQPSAYTQNCMEFCKEFENERQRSEEFVKLLRAHDLFEVKKATFTPQGPDGQPGEQQIIAEYMGVSEAKLAALSTDTLAELMKNGALQQIFVHLNSLVNWDRLIARAMRRQQLAAANDVAGNA
jgi:hypothetical protein